MQTRDLIVIPDHSTSDYSLSELEPQLIHDQDRDKPSQHTYDQDTEKCSENIPDDPGFPSEQEWSEPEDAVIGAENPGDATVLESEEFSIISVDSLASAPHWDGLLSAKPPTKSSVDVSAMPSSPTKPSVDVSVMPSSPPEYLPGNSRTPFLPTSPAADPAAPAQLQEHAPVGTPLQESARKSGKALQDVLKGPFRNTPSDESSQKTVFNGFSADTRRQLRESLYAGQSMATPPLPSQPNFGFGVQGLPHLAAQTSTFDSPFHSPVRKNIPASHRLPTPEAKDHLTSASSTSEVHYPNLDQSSAALVYDDMSWVATGATRPMSIRESPLQSAEVGTQEGANPHSHQSRRDVSQSDDSSAKETSPSETAGQDSGALNDIWQAEATDLPLKPRRSKLPGTWRRTSNANFHYSDSPEPEDVVSRRMSTATSASGILTPPTTEDEQFRQKFVRPTAPEHHDEEESESPADGDESGVFWQKNLPAVFSRPQPTRSTNSKLMLSPERNIDTSLQVDATVVASSPPKAISADDPTSSSQKTGLPSDRHPDRTIASDCIFMPSPLKHSLFRSSKFTTTHGDSLADNTTLSMASDERQLHSELMQHTLVDNTVDLSQTASSLEESEDEAESNISQSYVEELNRDSPTKIKVKFNDSSVQESAHDSTIHDDYGRSVLISPKKQYPPLFDQTTSASSNRDITDADATQQAAQPKMRPGGYVSRLTGSFWGAVTAQPVYTEARPTIVRSTSPMPAAEVVSQLAPSTMSMTPSVPDHVLRLRRKYGLLCDEHPFTYAHVRTLHRMLNSARARSGSSSIIPITGPLPEELQDLVGRTKTNDLDQRFTWTPKYAHVVASFMSLLLPAAERRRLVEHTGKEWGDAEALRYRGVDSKGRKGSDVVYPEKQSGEIESLWVARIVEDIIWKEEMNAKKKRVQHMLASVDQEEEKLQKVRPA